MSKADGSIKFDTEIETKGLTGQINKVSKEINKVADNKTLKSFSNLGNAITGLKSAFSMVTGAISGSLAALKSYNKFLTDTTNAYNTQLKAEIQLTNAVKNNPMIDGSAVNELKNFASELQKLTAYGDEETIPFIADLISNGRSVEETEQLMTAAANLAAGTNTDLATAVSTLNATYTGTLGTLGRQNQAFKDLTEEELKNGKAVELANKIYAGQAEQIADLTKSSEKAKGAIGDMFEAVGQFAKPAIDTFNKQIQSMAETATQVINDLNSFLDQQIIGKKLADTFTTSIADLRANGNSQFEVEQKTRDILVKLDQKDLEITRSYLESLKTRTTDEQDLLTLIKLQTEERAKWEKQDAERAKAAAKTSTGSKAKTDDEKAAEMIASTKSQIAAQEKALELEAKLGNTTVDNADLLNVYTSAYVDLISQSGGLITENNSYSQELLRTIEKLSAAQTDVNTSWEDNRKALVSALGSDESIESLKRDLKVVNDLIEEANAEGVDISSDLWAEYYEKREEMEEKLAQLTKDKAQETFESVISTLNEFVSAAQNIASSMSDIITTEADAKKDSETSAAEEQYNAGAISYEEYKAKLEQIDKEYAQKEYQAQMWEWSASLLNIGTSTAEAIVNALKLDYPLNIAMASVMGVMGAAQLGAAIANKPIPPSYATGGIVGGSSYSGDHVRANVNSGEMILNAQQQRQLWETANGRGAGGSGNSITIQNYRGNDTSVTPSYDDEGIKLVIRKTVNDDLKNRRYNASLKSAESTLGGMKYSS